jgi:cell division protein FtsB
MAARLVSLLLLVLLALVHAQLWLGRGSVTQVAHMKQELARQQTANRQSQLRNEQLAHEVRDLREGLDIIEEKARMELGMVKPNEIYVQVVAGKR